MIHPLIERELLRGSRSKAWARSVWWVVGILGAVFLLLWAVGAQNDTVGHWLFGLGIAVGAGFAAYAAMLLSTGILESESQNHMLELVVLSGVHPLALIASRMTIPFLVALQIALTAFPFVIVGPALGSVSGTELFLGMAVLFGIPLFVIAANALGACMAGGSGDAQTISAWLITAPFGLGWILTKVLAFFGLQGVAWTILVFNPIYVIHHWFQGPLTGTAAEFVSGLSPALLGIAYLAMATRRLAGVLREPRSLWLQRWRRRLHRTMIRSALNRAEPPYQRSTLLGLRSLVPAWFTVMAILGCWVLGAMVAPNGVLNDAAMITAYVAMLIVTSLARELALADRLATDRSGGHFELLLAAGIRPEEVVHGSERAVVDGFRPLVWLLIGVGFAMSIGAVALIPSNRDSWIIHALIWAGLILIPLGFQRRITFKTAWIAVWTGRPFYALSQSELMIAASALMVQFINIGRHLVSGSGSAVDFPRGTGIQWVVGAVLALVPIIAFFRRDPYRPVLIRDFRAILTEPPACLTEARFAKWKVETAVPLEETRRREE